MLRKKQDRRHFVWIAGFYLYWELFGLIPELGGTPWWTSLVWAAIPLVFALLAYFASHIVDWIIDWINRGTN